MTTPRAMDERYSVRLGRGELPIVLPNPSDPRLHLAGVILSIHLLGQVALDFRVSVVHIGSAIGTCFVIELLWNVIRRRALVWPASAMLTGSGVALILRLPDASANEPLATEGWHYYAAVAGLSLLSKYTIRYRGEHVFNPSNAVLVMAFVLLGSDRVEPLDFWWAPIGPAMVLAYALIIVGGLVIAGRLGLLGLALAFWGTLGVALGVLGIVGHCMTTLWSVTPVCDGHFWWVVMTSPETMVFLFFMITDPRTVPRSPRSRMVFGMAVALVSALLMAPHTTEFGAKVGLLGGLTVCAVIRLVVRVSVDSPVTVRALTRASPVRFAWSSLVTLGAVFVVVLVALGSSARSVDEVEDSEIPDVATLYPPPSQARVPAPSTTEEASVLAASLGATPLELAARLLWLLEVEADGLRDGDENLIAAATYGPRRTATLETLRSSPVPVPSYVIETMRLVLVRRGQGGVRFGFEVSGMVTTDYQDPDGRVTSTATQPFAALYVMIGFSGDRWVITDEIEPGSG